MKTKLRIISRKSVAVVLSVLTLVSCIAVGTITAGALGVKGYVYADLSGATNWGDHVSYIVGKSDYSTSYNMTKLKGTKLYYKSISGWDDATERAYHSGDWGSDSGEGNKISNRWSGTKHTSVETSWDFNSGSTYHVKITGSANDYSTSNTYYSGGYSDFNKELTIKTMYSSNGGNTYSETTTKYGTFSSTGAYKLTGNGASGTSSVSQTNGTGTLTTAMTNTASLSQTVTNSSTCEFVGWSTTKQTGSNPSVSSSYSFTNQGEDVTVYAYYKKEAYKAFCSVNKNGQRNIKCYN